jgi:hypothetical protein
MTPNRMLARLFITQLRLRFLGALLALILTTLALTLVFLIAWHRRGDTFALAFGALLSFFASVITAAVTLTYLHVSRRSLAAAEAAIALQREQWEARLTVQPRFWMGIRTESGNRFTPRPPRSPAAATSPTTASTTTPPSPGPSSSSTYGTMPSAPSASPATASGSATKNPSPSTVPSQDSSCPPTSSAPSPSRKN